MKYIVSTPPALAALLLIVSMCPCAGETSSAPENQRAGTGVAAATSAAVSPSIRPDLPPDLQAYAAIGSEMARNSRLREAGLSQAQREAFVAGVRASLEGAPYPYDESAARLFAELGKRVGAIEVEIRARQYAEPGAIEAYMKAACEKFRLQRADSGLAYAIVGGTGSLRPSPEDTVVFSMAATADDQESPIPQLTRERMRARVSDLMPGLAEAVQMMILDSRAMLILPPPLSFGAGSWPEGVARGSPVLLIVTLHEIISPSMEP